jgi:hypothetical protein
MMRTDDLIKVLSADAELRQASFGRAWSLAIAAAVVAAGLVFTAALGPRPDIGAAAHTMHFMFKFVVTGVLALTALPLLVALARPEAVGSRSIAWLAAAPLLLAIGVAIELAVMPAADWAPMLIGKNSPECPFLIVAIGAIPLALFVWSLRNAAPSRPALAGIVAGIAAGGVGASFYAAHCTDDSALFVATWYTLGVAMLAIAGGIAGRIVARW